MSELLDVLAVIGLVIVAVIFIAVFPFNETPLRPLFGFVLIFFAPGYALTSSLFPGDELNGTERMALSIGLSICTVIFIGLVLNYTPWGIRLMPILFCISAFTLIFAMMSAYTRIKHEEPQKDSTKY
jgi:uncharacterized membrane protein